MKRCRYCHKKLADPCAAAQQANQCENADPDIIYGDRQPRRIEGAMFVCELPRELGAVTKLSERGGKIVAETESGTPFIVPVGK